MYILGTYQHENPVLVLVHTEYTLFLCFRTQPGQSDMYQCILGMYWYEHFRRVSSRVSGFQMGHHDHDDGIKTLNHDHDFFMIKYAILKYAILISRVSWSEFRDRLAASQA
jgi:hypothetical protein